MTLQEPLLTPPEEISCDVLVPSGLRSKLLPTFTREFLLPLRDPNLQMFTANDRRLRSIAYRTLCDIHLTRRILNKRLRGCSVVKYAIVTIRGPDDCAIFQCNRLIERTFPEYFERRDYWPRSSTFTLFSHEHLVDNSHLQFSSQRMGMSKDTFEGLDVPSPYRLTESRREFDCPWKTTERDKRGEYGPSNEEIETYLCSKAVSYYGFGKGHHPSQRPEDELNMETNSDFLWAIQQPNGDAQSKLEINGIVDKPGRKKSLLSYCDRASTNRDLRDISNTQKKFTGAESAVCQKVPTKSGLRSHREVSFTSPAPPRWIASKADPSLARAKSPLSQKTGGKKSPAAELRGKSPASPPPRSRQTNRPVSPSTQSHTSGRKSPVRELRSKAATSPSAPSRQITRPISPYSRQQQTLGKKSPVTKNHSKSSASASALNRNIIRPISPSSLQQTLGKMSTKEEFRSSSKIGASPYSLNHQTSQSIILNELIHKAEEETALKMNETATSMRPQSVKQTSTTILPDDEVVQASLQGPQSFRVSQSKRVSKTPYQAILSTRDSKNQQLQSQESIPSPHQILKFNTPVPHESSVISSQQLLAEDQRSSTKKPIAFQPQSSTAVHKIAERNASRSKSTRPMPSLMETLNELDDVRQFDRRSQNSKASHSLSVSNTPESNAFSEWTRQTTYFHNLAKPMSTEENENSSQPVLVKTESDTTTDDSATNSDWSDDSAHGQDKLLQYPSEIWMARESRRSTRRSCHEMQPIPWESLPNTLRMKSSVKLKKVHTEYTIVKGLEEPKNENRHNNSVVSPRTVLSQPSKCQGPAVNVTQLSSAEGDTPSQGSDNLSELAHNYTTRQTDRRVRPFTNLPLNKLSRHLRSSFIQRRNWRRHQRSQDSSTLSSSSCPMSKFFISDDATESQSDAENYIHGRGRSSSISRFSELPRDSASRENAFSEQLRSSQPPSVRQKPPRPPSSSHYRSLSATPKRHQRTVVPRADKVHPIYSTKTAEKPYEPAARRIYTYRHRCDPATSEGDSELEQVHLLSTSSSTDTALSDSLSSCSTSTPSPSPNLVIKQNCWSHPSISVNGSEELYSVVA